MKGLLIVFEGCDKSGKTATSKSLVDILPNSIRFSFPDRTTLIGELLDKYLKSEVELTSRVSHLIFSANRWELESKIRNLLDEGTNVIIDRYYYSGIAYTIVKDPDIPLHWVTQQDKGLCEPDIVFLMERDTVYSSEERYETISFQEKVKNIFRDKLFDDKFWVNIDGNKSYEEVLKEIYAKIHTIKNGFTNNNR